MTHPKDPFWKTLFAVGKKRKNASNGNGLSPTLEEMIEERDGEQEPLDAGEQILLRNILKLSKITAEDVMVPRADIIAVDAATPYKELVELLNQSAHSRLPVYSKNLDNVQGMVHIKDVLGYSDKKSSFRLTMNNGFNKVTTSLGATASDSGLLAQGFEIWYLIP